MKIAEIQADAVRHNRLNLWVLGVAFVVSVSIGLAIWFLEPARDRDSAHFGLAGGAAAMVFFLAALGTRLLFPKPEAICPQCGCDWNAEGDNNPQTWLAWQRCPGCGLQMSDDHQ